MKAFETGLCNIPPPKKRIQEFLKSEVPRDFRQNNSVHGLTTFTRIHMVSKVLKSRLWTHPGIGNSVAILPVVSLVYDISLNYVIL